MPGPGAAQPGAVGAPWRAVELRVSGQIVRNAAQLDLVIEGALLVQVLSVEEVSASERQKMETLLRLGGLKAGLLVNFNVPVMRKGIERFTVKRREAD